MNTLQELLIKLKDLGCSGIKISFEDEGAQYNEVISMRYLTAKTGLELSVKIGGCEAKREILDCINVCCDTVVSPMIESRFALDKFVKSLEIQGYKNKKSFNLETITGYDNMHEIAKSINKMNSITVGRVDFVGSINKERDYVDSPEIYECVRNILVKSRKAYPSILCNMGGAISIRSKDFITNLIREGLLDYFETRYIIFKTKLVDMDKLGEMLYYANRFEIEWMKYIRERYTGYAKKDLSRIEMIEKRLAIISIEK
jgi:hypothetical protein